MRKHRRKECIHKERIDDESEEQCSKCNGGQVCGQSTLTKSLSYHEHARNTRCRACHQEHESGPRRNAFFNQSKCKRNGTRRAGVHRHCKHQHNHHAQQRVFVQEQEEIVRNKGCNQRPQQKSNDEPLAHIANHVHETVFKSFLNLLGKGLFRMFFIVVLTARAMVTIAITMFVFMVMFMMFVRFAHNGNACFRFIFCNYIRKQSTKHRRHESGYRAQNRKWSTQQRIRRQNGIYSRRRRRNQETHACALACALFTERNRRGNHTAAANRERDAKQSRPKHRLEIRLGNFGNIKMIRHPHMQNARQQKAEQQERSHLRKQRDKLPDKLFKNFNNRGHFTYPSCVEYA